MLKLLASPAKTRAARYAAAALERQATFVRQAPAVDGRTGQAIVIAEVHAKRCYGGRALDMDGSSLINCSLMTGTAVGRWSEVAGCHVLTVTGDLADVNLWLAMYDR